MINVDKSLICVTTGLRFEPRNDIWQSSCTKVAVFSFRQLWVVLNYFCIRQIIKKINTFTWKFSKIFWKNIFLIKKNVLENFYVVLGLFRDKTALKCFCQRITQKRKTITIYFYATPFSVFTGSTNCLLFLTLISFVNLHILQSCCCRRRFDCCLMLPIVSVSIVVSIDCNASARFGINIFWLFTRGSKKRVWSH